MKKKKPRKMTRKGNAFRPFPPCKSALANQLRLIIHTASYFLVWAVRAAAGLRSEFNTVRNALLKVAARVRETGTRIHVALSSSCPEQELFRVTLARLRDERFIDPARPPPHPCPLG